MCVCVCVCVELCQLAGLVLTTVLIILYIIIIFLQSVYKDNYMNVTSYCLQSYIIIMQDIIANNNLQLRYSVSS